MFGRSNFAAVVLQQELVQQKFKQLVAICAEDEEEDFKVPQFSGGFSLVEILEAEAHFDIYQKIRQFVFTFFDHL